VKVLITGGAGFIGSHLSRKLLLKNCSITVLDNLVTGSLDNIPDDVEFINKDIRDSQVQKIIIDGHYDAIVHLAAQTMVDSSIKDPLYDVSENLIGIVNLLEAARKSDVERVIFSSSAAVYGDVPEPELPIKEDRQVNPLSFYGLTKYTSERYLKLYHDFFSLNYVILRFANVYGERQGTNGEGGVISIFAQKIARNEPISIFGDGMQTRDFIYADDIAEGIYSALITAHVNDVYNLSSATESSIIDLINDFKNLTSNSIATVYKQPRDGDIFRSVLSNTKAINLLGWRPQFTIQSGLKNTFEYFLKRSPKG
jgi:UDP-glucose 4-epimerase